MEIEVLAPHVVDQIAAGEVVERPAHLVKELIENALDAQAKKITVSVSLGGREVTVVDDGIGMNEINMKKSIQRFATSKMRESDDLWRLQTYGFRGEALASIASVSEFMLISRTSDAEYASCLHSRFGQIQSLEQIGGQWGTTVKISQLFENVPARLKFLKSESAEHGQIRQVIKAMALSHPQVEFKYDENHELLFYFAQAQNLKERATQVLEKNDLILQVTEREGLRVEAVFSPAHHVAKTSRSIWIFAQNRWIQDRSIQAAVLDSYRGLLMHGEYPFAVISVSCHPSEIDVNIHPTKSQVKFQNQAILYRAVAQCLRQGLDHRGEVESKPQSVQLSQSMQPLNYRFQDEHLDSSQRPRKLEISDFAKLQVNDVSIVNFAPSSEAKSILKNASDHLGKWSRLEVLSQASMTYIVCQSDESLVLIDQHAAHERVAYERLMQAWNGGHIEVQQLLIPLVYDLGTERAEAVMGRIEEFDKIGLKLELTGPGVVAVLSGPALVKDSVYKSILEKVSTEVLNRGESFALEKIITDLFATMACHSVVRAGQALSVGQMKNLLQEMDEFPHSNYCPHGRPVSLEIPFMQIEKDFGRRG